MVERRPIWLVILALNVCVLIWLITVQEPAAMLEAESVGAGAGTGFVSSVGFQPVAAAYQKPPSPPHTNSKNFLMPAQQQQQLYAGKHLLSERNDSGANMLLKEKLANNYKISLKYKTDKMQAVWKHNNSSTTRSSSRSLSNNSSKSYNKTLAVSSTYMPSQPPTPLKHMPLLTATVHSSRSTVALSTMTAASISFPTGDFRQLIDIDDFAYLMPQAACQPHILALILVHSAPRNVEKRALIRDTWASSLHDTPLRMLFLLGRVAESSLQWQLQLENSQHGDMVQGSFNDDYRNMTYKHVMAFKWFLYNCAHAQILIKVDDDVYVNTPQLLKYMQLDSGTVVSLLNTSTNASQFNAVALFQRPHDLLFCEQYTGARVKRTYRSKWRVSFKEYAGRYYPPYCPGYAIIYSADVVARLYAAAQQHSYFWIDDVHITGVLAQQTNISISTTCPYVLLSEECAHLLAGKLALSAVEFLFAWHSISPQQIRQLWRLHLKEEAAMQQSNSSSSSTNVSSIVSPSAKSFVDYDNRPETFTAYAYDGFR